MKITEAIILAGGLGTRLRTVLPELPKCMAPVSGIPFLCFVIAYLQKEGIIKFIFSLGYKSEVIIDYLEKQYPLLDKTYVTEAQPLGTGGAIKLACAAATAQQLLVMNGDTLFNVDITEFSAFHFNKQADCSIALKQMKAFSRYGSIEISTDHAISNFKEKQYCPEGYINGGIYALSTQKIMELNLPDIFSFEKDFLEQFTGRLHFFGLPQHQYFIDIGIPEDYQTFTAYYETAGQKNKQEQKPGWDMFAAFIENIKEFLPQI